MGKSKHTAKHPEVAVSELIPYSLSDHTYIALKWTKLPTITPVAHSLWTKPWQCFRKREHKKILYYPKGQLAARFNRNGTGEIFYIDGCPAIELTQSVLGYQRIRLYSDTVQRGESRCLGWLDSFGNCVLNDVDGNIIATYNQTEGVIFSRDSFWKWQWSQLVKRIKAESGMALNVKKPKLHRDGHLDNSVGRELLDLYIQNSPGARTMKLQDGKISFQCKISSAISLWISNRDKIDLSFSSNSFITRLDVGVKIDDPSDLNSRQNIFMSGLASKGSGKSFDEKRRMR